MAFYKLICTHERPSKLRNSLEDYASSWNAGLIQSPDICVVIDSSQEPDQYLSEYRPLAFLRYIHAPGAVVAVKQQLFINRFNPTRFDFVDFSSDEDLYLRDPLISESPFIAQLDNSFSWLYFDCNEQMNKHEYLLLRDIRPIASNFLHPSSALSESDKYLASFV